MIKESKSAQLQIRVVSPAWLNDGVKGFLSKHGDFTPYLALDHLWIMLAQPAYLLRHLNVESYETGLERIMRYYPLERFPRKTLYALQEILSAAQ